MCQCPSSTLCSQPTGWEDVTPFVLPYPQGKALSPFSCLFLHQAIRLEATVWEKIAIFQKQKACSRHCWYPPRPPPPQGAGCSYLHPSLKDYPGHSSCLPLPPGQPIANDQLMWKSNRATKWDRLCDTTPTPEFLVGSDYNSSPNHTSAGFFCSILLLSLPYRFLLGLPSIKTQA